MCPLSSKAQQCHILQDISVYSVSYVGRGCPGFILQLFPQNVLQVHGSSRPEHLVVFSAVTTALFLREWHTPQMLRMYAVKPQYFF